MLVEVDTGLSRMIGFDIFMSIDILRGLNIRNDLEGNNSV